MGGGWEKDFVMCSSPSPKDCYPPWMGVLHCMLSKYKCQRLGGPYGREKDMCLLESSSDRIVRSPWVHLGILKATLFFNSFFLRDTPRAPRDTVVFL